MAYVRVLVIAAINCVLLFFVAFLAGGADGGFERVKTIWLSGYLWAALLTAVALALCARKRGSAGVVVAASTLPSAYLASLAAISVGAGFTYLKPASSEFTKACKSAEAKFLSSPREPVRSLGYEWGQKYPIEINYFQISPNNYASVETRNPPYPEGVTIIEDVPSSADVRISFTFPIGKDELWKAYSHQGLVGYGLTVLDQRSKRTLATLRYFTDLSNKKACGPTIKGVLSVRAFVLKAIKSQ